MGEDPRIVVLGGPRAARERTGVVLAALIRRIG